MSIIGASCQARRVCCTPGRDGRESASVRSATFCGREGNRFFFANPTFHRLHSLYSLSRHAPKEALESEKTSKKCKICKDEVAALSEVISTSVLFTRRCFNDAPRRPPSCRPPEVPWETIVRPRLALPRRLTSRATRSLRRSKEDSPPRRFPKTRRVSHCLCLFAAKQDGFRVVRRVGFSARRGDVAGVEEHRSARGLVFVIARRARWGWPGGPVFSARGLAACLRQPCGARRRACVRHVPAPA